MPINITEAEEIARDELSEPPDGSWELAEAEQDEDVYEFEFVLDADGAEGEAKAVVDAFSGEILEFDEEIEVEENEGEDEGEDGEEDENEDEDDESESLAAIGYVSFCVAGESGPGNEPCPDGERELVRFEAEGGNFDPDGDPSGVSIEATESKDDGSGVVAAEWSAEEAVETVVVKAGPDTCDFDGGTSGTVRSCGPPPGQDSPASVGASGTLHVILLVALSALVVGLSRPRRERAGVSRS